MFKGGKKIFKLIGLIFCVFLVYSCSQDNVILNKEFYVTFESNGGTHINPITVLENDLLIMPTNPIKEGYIFKGWFTDIYLSSRFDELSVIEDNITLYAKWELKELDGIIYSKIESGYSVTGFRNENLQTYDLLVIPETYLGLTVTRISARAFYLNDYIFNYSLPESLVEIGDYAFFGAVMNELNIPSSVKIIGESAFSYCSLITSITISNTIEVIGENAFAECYNLKEVNIPFVGSKRDSTGNEQNFKYVFGNSEYCHYDKVNITDVDRIKAYSFSNVGNVYEINFPETVTVIEDYAFSNCRNITEITIPSGLIYLGRGAFISCKNLKNIIINAPLSIIREYTFAACSELENFIFPDTIEIIEGNAFENCDKLNNITFPESLKTILNSAFASDSGLTNLVIPKTVTYIEEGAFASCYRLVSIEIPFVGDSADSPKYFGSIFGGFDNVSNSIVVPYSIKKITITSGDKIYPYAFSDCPGIENIYLTETIKEIGSYAFYKCERLNYISFDYVTSILSHAFDECTFLSSVTIKDITVVIEELAFNNSIHLVINVMLPEKPITWDDNWAGNTSSILWNS
ncbi:MAG: leucine-rich repeat protein [Acholeplasmatales bacterium]|jgi:uncharacterized repeat protein (TIGR02543 family)|nr:leucine-rich repeat protein [Acholeplasmatales bacterium]